MSISFDVKFRATTTLSQLRQVRAQLANLPQEAHKHFVSVTPIDTGNARRNTSLQGKTIHANYPYAKRLDEGWSNQAKRGMIKPTEEFIRRRVKQITGK